MRRIFICLFILCGLVACENSKTISLNSSEKKQALQFIEKRRDLQTRRQEMESRYQAERDQTAAEERQINIDYDNFCFKLRKEHHIGYEEKYRLNEFKGTMERD